MNRMLSALWRSLLLLAIVAGLGACSDFLDDLIAVDVPSRIPASEFEVPENAQTLVLGAIADFECALSHYIVAGGLAGDELQDGSSSVHLQDYDRRTYNESYYGGASCDNIFTTTSLAGAVGVYAPLSQARWQADNVLKLLDSWTDSEVSGRGELIAKAVVYAGYSYLLMGEAMCSAAFDSGPEVNRSGIFALARDRFDRAIEAAQAEGATDILNLARVGKARTLLNLGNSSSAASVAQDVPKGFIYFAGYSSVSQRRENQVWVKNSRQAAITVEDDYRNLSFAGVPDPRVELVDAGQSTNDGLQELWLQSKYPSAGSSIPLATWEEAQLILAEAALEAGDLQEAVRLINLLHDQVGLPGFESQDLEEITEQLVYERRAELFLEGHHLGDVIRLGLNRTPEAGTPFIKGGAYGTDSCFPLPAVERFNNPSLGR